MLSNRHRLPWSSRLNAAKSARLALVALPDEQNVEENLALHFTRVDTPVDDLEIWMASSGGFSFVVSNESRSGPGLHGQPGFVASWRPIHPNKPAIRIAGSPFNTFAEAEKACEAFQMYLKR